MKKKWISSLLAMSLCVSSIMPVCATESMNQEEMEVLTSGKSVEDLVEIPDNRLKEALMSEVDDNNDEELSKSELLNLKSLVLWNKGEDIDLTGLEYATNLEAITFYESSPKNIEILENLTNLKNLKLMNNQLTSIPDFHNLKNLESLNLDGNQLTSVPDFQNLRNLKSLSLAGNQLESIPNFQELPNLETLYLTGNKLTSVPDFQNLKNLEILDLYNNQLISVPDFQELTNIKLLDLSYNQLTSVPNFQGMTNLETLYLAGNQLTSVPDFCDLISLVRLDLSKNPISNISSIAEIDQNVKISLSSNESISWESLFEVFVDEISNIIIIEGNTIYKIPNSIKKFTDKFSLDGKEFHVNEIVFEIKNTKIAQIENEIIKGNTVGKTDYILTYGNTQKTCQIEVVEREESTSNLVEGTMSIKKLDGNAAVFLDVDRTLWGINDTKVEKVKTNVKQYIAELVYGKRKITTWGNYLVLDDENTLWKHTKNSFSEAYQNKELLKNVEIFDDKYALLTNGELYELSEQKKLTENIKKYYSSNSIYVLTKDEKIIDISNDKVYAENVNDAYIQKTNRIYAKTILLVENSLVFGIIDCEKKEFSEKSRIEDVKQILNDDYFIKIDGSVWRWDDINEWGVTTFKVANEMPIFINYEYMIDSENVLWKIEYSGNIKLMENVEKIDNTGIGISVTKLDKTIVYLEYNWRTDSYEVQENVIKKLGEYYLKSDGTLWENNNYIMDDVTDFGAYDFEFMDGNVYILRKDGSVWICEPNKGKGAPELLKEGITKKGDINTDTNISIKDVQMVFSYISGKLEFTSEQLKSADINGDGKITTNDMQRIFYYVNGKIAEL